MIYRLLSILLIVFTMGCRFETVRMQGYEVHGIDVSHYQSYINWDTVAVQGVDFAFIKATEGADLVDTLFYLNWFAAQAVNIKRGAYHFFRPATAADAQAINFMETVQIEPGDLAPVLDVEVLDGVAPQELVAGMSTWLQIVEQTFEIKPIIYTNLKFYHQYLAGQFDNHPIWIARYNPTERPYLESDRKWHFWQYGNRGRLRGICGDVDFNVFRGSKAELEDLCLGPHPELSMR